VTDDNTRHILIPVLPSAMAVRKARMHMLQMRLIQATAIVISGMTLKLEALELQISTFHLYHDFKTCTHVAGSSLFSFTPILDIF
jgi:hypothetical protein